VKSTTPNQVRIIGGEWRGRRLPVIDLPGLRPSGDRCRETLFNWLQAYVPGASCVDLFAGTGALGLEAASRGAGSVVLVEKNSAVVSSLERSVDLLHALSVRVEQRDAFAWLTACALQSLDIAFVDPPFDEGLGPQVMAALETSGCLREGGFVYFETAADGRAVVPPAGWSTHREKTLGRVRMQLFRRQSAA